MNKTQKKIYRFMNNLLSITIYGQIFMLLTRLSAPTFSMEQCVGIGFILGFFMGAINNLERVLRELFDKEYQKELEI